jgi:hypothetical protein
MKHCALFVAFCLSLLGLCSCDDVLGFGTYRIGAGYYLARTDTNELALIPPDTGFGPTVSDVGWRKPFIISRYDIDRPWDVIDTSTKQQVSISDAQRRTDPKYREIPVYRAEEASKHLGHWKSQW